MQKQHTKRKQGIEWCDYTWNPVTGCMHGCEYCYARRIANRFKPQYLEFINRDDCVAIDTNPKIGCVVCEHPVKVQVIHYGKWIDKRITPYPHGFYPTFHRYRLDEPQHIKKPSKIFVSSMGELFGEWVPDEWIREVFAACERAPWHTYLFLTKNAERLTALQMDGQLPRKSNHWYGTTITGEALDETPYTSCVYNTFVSCEPLLGPIHCFSRLSQAIDYNNVRWIIIGAMTGPGSKQYQPGRQWVADIVDQCHAAEVPVFMKRSLTDIWGEPLIQEWPEGMG